MGRSKKVTEVAKEPVVQQPEAKKQLKPKKEKKVEPAVTLAQPVQEETSDNDKNMKHYLVVYLTDGTIHLWPGDSKAECIKTKNELLSTKWAPRVKTCRFIKRNLNNCKDGYIL